MAVNRMIHTVSPSNKHTPEPAEAVAVGDRGKRSGFQKEVDDKSKYQAMGSPELGHSRTRKNGETVSDGHQQTAGKPYGPGKPSGLRGAGPGVVRVREARGRARETKTMCTSGASETHGGGRGEGHRAANSLRTRELLPVAGPSGTRVPQPPASRASPRPPSGNALQGDRRPEGPTSARRHQAPSLPASSLRLGPPAATYPHGGRDDLGGSGDAPLPGRTVSSPAGSQQLSFQHQPGGRSRTLPSPLRPAPPRPSGSDAHAVRVGPPTGRSASDSLGPSAAALPPPPGPPSPGDMRNRA